MTKTRPTPVSRHAVTFIFVTVLLDMVGFGIIIPVLPKLIGPVADVSLAEAAKIGGWMAAAYSVAQFLFGPLMVTCLTASGAGPCCCWRFWGWGWIFWHRLWHPQQLGCLRGGSWRACAGRLG